MNYNFLISLYSAKGTLKVEASFETQAETFDVPNAGGFQ